MRKKIIGKRVFVYKQTKSDESTFCALRNLAIRFIALSGKNISISNYGIIHNSGMTLKT